MTELLLGLLGAALGAAFFMAGFWFGRRTTSTPPLAREGYTPTAEEEAAIEEERERLREEQAAFHDLMGYNADVAYGRRKLPGKE